MSTKDFGLRAEQQSSKVVLVLKRLLLAGLPLLFTVASCGSGDGDDSTPTKGYSLDELPKELEPFIRDIEFIDNTRGKDGYRCLVMWLYFEMHKLDSDELKDRLSAYCATLRLKQLLEP